MIYFTNNIGYLTIYLKVIQYFFNVKKNLENNLIIIKVNNLYYVVHYNKEYKL
jgi:hypothetical protein